METAWEVIKMSFVAMTANGLVLAAIAYLLKSIIGNQLTKSLQSHEDTLRRKTDTALSAYRSDLEKEQLRLQISYGGIFERQAEAVLQLHQLLVNLQKETHFAVNAAKPANEKKEIFVGAWSDLRQHYLNSRILIPESIDLKMDQFVESIFFAVDDYLHVEINNLQHLTKERMSELFDSQASALNVIREEIPKLTEELVIQMRKLLGAIPVAP